MTGVRLEADAKDIVIAVGIAWLLGGAVTGRARQAMWKVGATLVPGSTVTTRVTYGWPLGIPLGDTSAVEVRTEGGSLAALARLQTSKTAALPAHVREVRVRTRNVRILGMDGCDAVLVLGGVVLDGWRILRDAECTMLRSGSGEAVVVVPATAVARFARERLPGTGDIQVGFSSEGFSVSGYSIMPPGRFSVVGSLQVRSGREVHISCSRSWLNGTEVPPSAVAGFLNRLNPVFTLDQAPELGKRLVLMEARPTEGAVRLVLRVLPVSQADLHEGHAK